MQHMQKSCSWYPEETYHRQEKWCSYTKHITINWLLYDKQTSHLLLKMKKKHSTIPTLYIYYNTAFGFCLSSQFFRSYSKLRQVSSGEALGIAAARCTSSCPTNSDKVLKETRKLFAVCWKNTARRSNGFHNNTWMLSNKQSSIDIAF